MVHRKRHAGHVFATRLSTAFVIGEEEESEVELPKKKGVKLSIIEEKEN